MELYTHVLSYFAEFHATFPRRSLLYSLSEGTEGTLQTSFPLLDSSRVFANQRKEVLCFTKKRSLDYSSKAPSFTNQDLYAQSKKTDTISFRLINLLVGREMLNFR